MARLHRQARQRLLRHARLLSALRLGDRRRRRLPARRRSARRLAHSLAAPRPPAPAPPPSSGCTLLRPQRPSRTPPSAPGQHDLRDICAHARAQHPWRSGPYAPRAQLLADEALVRPLAAPATAGSCGPWRTPSPRRPWACRRLLLLDQRAVRQRGHGSPRHRRERLPPRHESRQRHVCRRANP
jgi:hypothetical protein